MGPGPPRRPRSVGRGDHETVRIAAGAPASSHPCSLHKAARCTLPAMVAQTEALL